MVNNQLKQAIATTLNINSVLAAFGKNGAKAHSGAKIATADNIIFLAFSGCTPFLLTSQSDQAEVPMAPRSATKKGIHPTMPTSARLSPDSSCK